MSDVFWSVDSLVVKDNTLFGFGWAFHELYEITQISFRLTFNVNNELSSEYIYADIGKPREDVGREFTAHHYALNSGYVIFGAYKTVAKLSSVELVCGLVDGSVVELEVPLSRVIQSSSGEVYRGQLMLRQFHVFFKRGVDLIRSGKLSSLFEKIIRYLNGRPKSIINNPAELYDLLKLNERNNIYLIVDHNLGGGANHYRDRLVATLVKEGGSVIVFTYHVPTLSYMVLLINGRINLRLAVPDTDFILRAVEGLPINGIIYNTAVSFAKPEDIPELLINIKNTTSATLRILVHDFFIICPSHFLIDNEGKYCGLPNVSVCSKCLPNNQQGFVTLYRESDIVRWRSLWGSLVAVADDIVTFSNNSADILLKAYPQIKKSTISIVPHDVSHMPSYLPDITNKNELCIGVIGQIGRHKGAGFIQALAQEITLRKLNLKIVVIGSIEASCETSVVSQTGSYQHESLPGLIEASGANVFLFPSIWPETFSYVVQELMDLDLPVASFDLGAPAERLAHYPKGLVLDSMDPRRVLDDLISFHRKTYH